jgi:hypothetical protein
VTVPASDAPPARWVTGVVYWEPGGEPHPRNLYHQQIAQLIARIVEAERPEKIVAATWRRHSCLPRRRSCRRLATAPGSVDRLTGISHGPRMTARYTHIVDMAKKNPVLG